MDEASSPGHDRPHGCARGSLAARGLAAVPAFIMLGSGATAATAICYVDGGLEYCCFHTPSGPNLDRYCGVFPFGSQCDDSIVDDGPIPTVAQGYPGKLSTTKSGSALCEYQRNSCAMIGCKWLTPNAKISCTGQVPSGPDCAQSCDPCER